MGADESKPREEKMPEKKRCHNYHVFEFVKGLDKVDPKDIEAQKDLALKAMHVWEGSDRSNIEVKDISGMGGSRTYMIINKGANPERVILHNKVMDMNNSESVESEMMQERIVKVLSDVKATPPRLVEGDSWYIEPCAGTQVQIRNDPSKVEQLNSTVKQVADCLA